MALDREKHTPDAISLIRRIAEYGENPDVLLLAIPYTHSLAIGIAKASCESIRNFEPIRQDFVAGTIPLDSSRNYVQNAGTFMSGAYMAAHFVAETGH